MAKKYTLDIYGKEIKEKLPHWLNEGQRNIDSESRKRIRKKYRHIRFQTCHLQRQLGLMPIN